MLSGLKFGATTTAVASEEKVRERGERVVWALGHVLESNRVEPDGRWTDAQIHSSGGGASLLTVHCSGLALAVCWCVCLSVCLPCTSLARRRLRRAPGMVTVIVPRTASATARRANQRNQKNQVNRTRAPRRAARRANINEEGSMRGRETSTRAGTEMRVAAAVAAATAARPTRTTSSLAAVIPLQQPPSPPPPPPPPLHSHLLDPLWCATHG